MNKWQNNRTKLEKWVQKYLAIGNIDTFSGLFFQKATCKLLLPYAGARYILIRGSCDTKALIPKLQLVADLITFNTIE